MVERIQKVVFMRHAVARHNVIDPATGKQPSLTDASLLDPPLVTEGKIQAVIAGDAIQTWGRNNTTTQAREQQQMNHLLIVTSPLTRCIQTATLAFLPGHDYERQLKPLTIVCKEDTREAHGGGHYPDKRREKSVLQRHWPNVHFEETMTEHDDAWKIDRRETWNDIGLRVHRFLVWLVQEQQQQYDTVVVVSHGVWIETLLRTHAPAILVGRDGGKRRVYNTDAFCCECVSANGAFVRIQNVRQICGQQHIQDNAYRKVVAPS